MNKDETMESGSPMAFQPSLEELTRRIQHDIDYYKGNLPERHAIAWYGYVFGLHEWGLIDPNTWNALIKLLPFVDNNPIADIAIGFANEE